MTVYTQHEAYMKLSALCAAAEYCILDMRRKMSRWLLVPDGSKSVDTNADESDQQALADAVIVRLVKEGFIDERRYAHAFVRDKFRYNRWGSTRISQELRMRRIDSSIISEALEEIDEDDCLATLRQLIDRKRPSVKGRSDYEIRGKLIRFALGRGYSMDDILKVMGDE